MHDQYPLLQLIAKLISNGNLLSWHRHHIVVEGRYILERDDIGTVNTTEGMKGQYLFKLFHRHQDGKSFCCSNHFGIVLLRLDKKKAPEFDFFEQSVIANKHVGLHVRSFIKLENKTAFLQLQDRCLPALKMFLQKRPD